MENTSPAHHAIHNKYSSPKKTGLMRRGVALALAVLGSWGVQNAAYAEELKVLSGNGAKAAVTALCAEFARISGHKVTVDFEVNPGVKKRIEGGEAFDVAVLNPPVLDELIAQSRVVDSTRTVLGRAGIGAAIREGAPKPDISTVEGFKRTLLGYKSVAYPGEGASGKYFASLVERMGIGEEMKSRMRPMPAEYNVEVVASGEVDMVVVVSSRISGVRGVQYLGTIPSELQTWIGFAAGLSAKAAHEAAARDMLNFFTTPQAVQILRDAGVDTN
jgi:molybdate transport system substrate-binding protein